MIRQVAPGIYEVSLPRRGIPVNAFLVAGDGLALVDTGVPGSWHRIAAAIRGVGRDPAELRVVGVTHHHVDHVGSLAEVVGQTGAEVVAHTLEAGLVEGRQAPPPKVARTAVNRFRIWVSDRVGWKEAMPAKVDRPVVDGTEVAGTGLRAIHTPGHTAGHLAYLHAGSGVLIVGDAAANVFGRLSGPIGDHDVDRDAMVASVARLARVDFETVCFGHGRSIQDGARRRLTELAERLAG